MALPIFDHAHPKIIEITFNFSAYAPARKNISSFHLFLFVIQSILASYDHTDHSHS